MITIVLIGILAYLIGSIPSAVWVGKLFYGKDVRLYGSRSAGATNTFRVLGKTAGTIVLVSDISKGVAAVLLSYLVKDNILSHDRQKLLEISLGLIAAIGHIYPVFAGFKGGKGVATITGALYAIFPIPALITTGVFLLVFILSNYISLSSITSSIAFPLITYFTDESYSVYIYSTLLLIPLFIIYTHRTNIGRLLKGEENKMYLFKKSVKQ